MIIASMFPFKINFFEIKRNNYFIPSRIDASFENFKFRGIRVGILNYYYFYPKSIYYKKKICFYREYRETNRLIRFVNFIYQ